MGRGERVGGGGGGGGSVVPPAVVGDGVVLSDHKVIPPFRPGDFVANDGARELT